jgi:hypothetical protein
MKIFQKATLVALVVSLFLTSCGVKGPDPIDWDSDSSDASTGSDMGTIDNTFINIPDIECTDDESRANKCNGDSDYGFDEINGEFFCYVDGICYTIADFATEDEETAIRNTLIEIDNTKDKTRGDTGEAVLAYAVSLISFAEMGLISGCTIGAAVSLGGTCLLALIAAGIAGIAFIVKYWAVINDVVKMLQAQDYLLEKVKQGKLIPCGGN